MVGVLAIGKKAVTFGYKRYGLPGAIMVSGATAIGYVVVKRALRSTIDEGSITSAINTDELKSAVDEKGLDAVRETETLRSAIDEDELESAVDIDVVQSATESEADELTETTESTNEGHGDEHSDDEPPS